MKKYLVFTLFLLALNISSACAHNPSVILSAEKIMKDLQYKIHATHVIVSNEHYHAKKITVISGSYQHLSKSKTKGISYGSFILFLSFNEFQFKKEALITNPGDDIVRYHYIDLDDDGLKDLILFKGDEEHSSTIFYKATFGSTSMTFAKIYENTNEYLYPYDIQCDDDCANVPYFIVPNPASKALFVLPNWCNGIEINLQNNVLKKITQDYKLASSKFIDYHSWPRIDESEKALITGNYFNDFSVLSFSKGRPIDVSSRFKKYYRKRISIIEQIIQLTDLPDQCRLMLEKVKVTLEESRRGKREPRKR
jgi:hypothetical protein